jgi:hypothetical protein
MASFRKTFKSLYIEPFVPLTSLAQIPTRFTGRALQKEFYQIGRNLDEY